jgi:hypothetical protein
VTDVRILQKEMKPADEQAFATMFSEIYFYGKKKLDF